MGSSPTPGTRLRLKLVSANEAYPERNAMACAGVAQQSPKPDPTSAANTTPVQAMNFQLSPQATAWHARKEYTHVYILSRLMQ